MSFMSGKKDPGFSVPAFKVFLYNYTSGTIGIANGTKEYNYIRKLRKYRRQNLILSSAKGNYGPPIQSPCFFTTGADGFMNS